MFELDSIYKRIVDRYSFDTIAQLSLSGVLNFLKKKFKKIVIVYKMILKNSHSFNKFKN